ncbi:site-specific tyrosine recombinase XerC [Xenorhabdus szentirmaii]|uniref:Tyrosine recombinase xerC 2 n=1 Tax=Xenorhabdus szentirmaii DSM 16338 TaxID=1427518 RepID=W1IRJ9_9GAMM|nr:MULTISPECIES: site-specific tyrosine recombinase XerC [Xenorhabdus]MBD2806550.1 site-specific tyrosine recombinase XerC [Xenorhabdus sp. ZM]MBD2822383.1 site-specific tyrosine recombinase XerC [Xenorhabdus sp. 42]PHM33620.1 integrase/recombinase [Xenorhabdus szentirmaii DSM 16338]PHM42274.1 integrase/recombinase [Xenorhabdus szentirmaii]CDL81107.1 Tyrosine recombinase xerC 2 [Xenorhabdus szentirmaii DSM 16338]
MASLTLRQHIQHFLDHLDALRYTQETRAHYRGDLLAFAQWCDERGITTAQQVSFPQLESWQQGLSAQKNRHGRRITAGTIVKKLTSVRHLFRWLVKRQHLLYNPARELELPRPERRLPWERLSEQETRQVLDRTDSERPLSVRDRAMMETLWSTGLRRSELQRLQVGDVDFARGELFVRQGKGYKDRVVPLGESARHWLQQYLNDVRPRLVWANDPGYLFLSQQGKALADGTLTQIVRNALHRAGIDKPGGCHLFRHSMATQMLENGADTRHIQAILGHASLDATQIYTRVAIGHLKEVHQQTHPAERPGHGPSDTEPPENSAGRSRVEGTASDRQRRRSGQSGRSR